MRTGRDFAGASDPARNPNFCRQWGKPEPIGDVADRLGRRAVAHWLRQAEKVDGAERLAALETADQIREALGISWADMLDKAIAA